MKIIAISDLHGHLPPDIPACDLLLIAGDICPATNHAVGFQRQWLEQEFEPWLQAQSARHIVGIAGNHDWIFEQPRLVPELSWHYLENESVELEGLHIYGTPWQPVFYDWAFNLTETELDEKFQLIPETTDILISHGPPLGYGDMVTEGPFFSGVPCGSSSLLKHLRRVRPRLCVFGHIHSADHATLELGVGNETVLLQNVSYLNEKYEPAYEPAVFHNLF